MDNGRDNSGRFGQGNRYGKGRPPRNYSIAHAMSQLAGEETTTDDGETVTRAQWASRWLWSVVTSGQDRNKEVGFKDRLEALKTILSRIEPDFKLNDKNVGTGDEEAEAEAVIERLESLSAEELAVLEKLAIRKADDE